MSTQILGRAIKNEYLALGTYALVGGIVALTSGGKKEAKAAPGKSTLDKIKEAVPINAGSSEEEQLMSSIKKFIADAEKEAGSSH